MRRYSTWTSLAAIATATALAGCSKKQEPRTPLQLGTTTGALAPHTAATSCDFTQDIIDITNPSHIVSSADWNFPTGSTVTGNSANFTVTAPNCAANLLEACPGDGHYYVSTLTLNSWTDANGTHFPSELLNPGANVSQVTFQCCGVDPQTGVTTCEDQIKHDFWLVLADQIGFVDKLTDVHIGECDMKCNLTKVPRIVNGVTVWDDALHFGTTLGGSFNWPDFNATASVVSPVGFTWPSTSDTGSLGGVSYQIYTITGCGELAVNGQCSSSPESQPGGLACTGQSPNPATCCEDLGGTGPAQVGTDGVTLYCLCADGVSYPDGGGNCPCPSSSFPTGDGHCCPTGSTYNSVTRTCQTAAPTSGPCSGYCGPATPGHYELEVQCGGKTQPGAQQNPVTMVCEADFDPATGWTNVSYHVKPNQLAVINKGDCKAYTSPVTIPNNTDFIIDRSPGGNNIALNIVTAKSFEVPSVRAGGVVGQRYEANYYVLWGNQPFNSGDNGWDDSSYRFTAADVAGSTTGDNEGTITLTTNPQIQCKLGRLEKNTFIANHSNNGDIIDAVIVQCANVPAGLFDSQTAITVDINFSSTPVALKVPVGGGRGVTFDIYYQNSYINSVQYDVLPFLYNQQTYKALTTVTDLTPVTTTANPGNETRFPFLTLNASSLLVDAGFWGIRFGYNAAAMGCELDTRWEVSGAAKQTPALYPTDNMSRYFNP